MVDVDEVSEEEQKKPKWLFGSEHAEVRKHRMVRAVEGQKSSSAQRYEKHVR